MQCYSGKCFKVKQQFFFDRNIFASVAVGGAATTILNQSLLQKTFRHNNKSNTSKTKAI